MQRSYFKMIIIKVCMRSQTSDNVIFVNGMFNTISAVFGFMMKESYAIDIFVVRKGKCIYNTIVLMLYL